MLVLTRDEAIPVLNEVIGVPATSRIRGIASEVRLGPDNGMPTECVLAVDNTQRIRRSYLTTRITQLDTLAMQQVCEALRFVVDC
jgi:mRNA interferase MazF